MFWIFTAHPNKEQFEQYLEQWKTYEQQMEARRKSIEMQKEKLEHELSQSSAPALSGSNASAGWQGKFGQPFKADNQSHDQPGSLGWDRSNQAGGHSSVPVSQNIEQGGLSRENRLLQPQEQRHFANRAGDSFTGPVHKFDSNGRAGQAVSGLNQFSGGANDGRSDLPQQHQDSGTLEDEKGEEDMNLEDDDESGGGGIIESNERQQVWQGKEPAASDSHSQQSRNGWNPWNKGSSGQNPGPWEAQRDNFGGTVGPDHLRGGGTASRGFHEAGSFRGRGRGEWSSGNLDQGSTFGVRGQPMKGDTRFLPPGSDGDQGRRDSNEYDGEGFDESSLEKFDDSADVREETSLSNSAGRGFIRGRGQWSSGRGGDFQRGRGNDFQRGMGSEFQRGRGGDFQRGMGGEFQRGRGSDFQRGMGGEFQRGRGGDFQRGIGGELQRGRGSDFQRGRGGDFQGGDGGRMGNFSDPGRFEYEGGPPRGRGGLPPRGRGAPPSLLSFEFNESMRHKFSDFDPTNEREQDSEDNAGYEVKDSFGDEGRDHGGMRGRGENRFFNEDRGIHAQQGRGFGDRGRGAIDRGHGRGGFRGRGGFSGELMDRDSQPDFCPGARGQEDMAWREGAGNSSYGDSHQREELHGRFDQTGRPVRGEQEPEESSNSRYLLKFSDSSDEFQKAETFNLRERMEAIARGQGVEQIRPRNESTWDEQPGDRPKQFGQHEQQVNIYSLISLFLSYPLTCMFNEMCWE